jgi:hypothetical protein
VETIRELLISLGLDVHQAEFVEAIGLEKLLEKGAEMLVEALEEIPKVLVEVVKETAEYAHQVESMADRTGQTTDEVQQFGYVMALAGEDIQGAEMSMSHLARTMDGARKGNAEAQQAFARLGVHVTDATGKLRPLNEVMQDIGEGFKKVQGPERMALAVEVLGRGGAKLINVLPQLKKRMEEFDELGLGMSEEDVARAAELQVNFTILGQTLDALKREFAGPLIEALTPVVDSMIEWVKANRAVIKSRLTGFATMLGKALSGLAKVAGFLIENWKAAAVVVGVAFQYLAIEALAAGGAAIGSALGAAAAWVAAVAPVVLMVALMAALILAAQDVMVFLRGGKSLIGEIGPQWTKFLDDFTRPNPKDPWWLAALKTAARILSDLQTAWDAWSDAITGGSFDKMAKVLGMTPSGPSASVLVGGAAGPGPAASMAAGSRGGVASGGMTNNFVINTHPGQSPEAIANATAEKFDDMLSRRLRETWASGAPQ